METGVAGGMAKPLLELEDDELLLEELDEELLDEELLDEELLDEELDEELDDELLELLDDELLDDGPPVDCPPQALRMAASVAAPKTLISCITSILDRLLFFLRSTPAGFCNHVKSRSAGRCAARRASVFLPLGRIETNSIYKIKRFCAVL